MIRMVVKCISGIGYMFYFLDYSWEGKEADAGGIPSYF